MNLSSEELKLNAQLQQKKNRVRLALKEKGVLPKGAVNNFDRYKYFSEAQYKELFTELFSENGLELKATTKDYEFFDGSDKMPNGRKVTVTFSLIDVETGWSEDSDIVGEGLDKGDKAGYKAYTGALKYYFAENFAVATGDDPETESPEAKTTKRVSETLKDFQMRYDVETRKKIREHFGKKSDEDLGEELMRRYITKWDEDHSITSEVKIF